MGLLDDLRNTSIDTCNNFLHAEFPEAGETDKAMLLADETIEMIKQVLSQRVNEGNFKKSLTGYYYEYTSVYESEVKISTDLTEERSTLKGPTLVFSNWQAAFMYFAKIDSFLESEGMYREWKLRSLPISSALNSVGIKKKIPLTKQADIHVFLNELYRKLKEKWYEQTGSRVKNDFSYISVYEDYSLVVKVFCDSKGIVK